MCVCVYVLERFFLPFCSCTLLLIMSMKILFIEVPPSRGEGKSVRFTIHFHILRGIKLLCSRLTKTYTGDDAREKSR